MRFLAPSAEPWTPPPYLPAPPAEETPPRPAPEVVVVVGAALRGSGHGGWGGVGVKAAGAVLRPELGHLEAVPVRISNKTRGEYVIDLGLLDRFRRLREN